jgi:hypothetical protein
MRIYNLEYTAKIVKYANCLSAIERKDGTRLAYSQYFNLIFKPVEGSLFRFKSILTDKYRYKGNSVGEIIALFRDDVGKQCEIFQTKEFYLDSFEFIETYTIKPDFSDFPTIIVNEDNHKIKINAIPEQESLVAIIQEEFTKGNLDFEEFTDAIIKLDCIDLENKKISDLPNIGYVRLTALINNGYHTIQDVAYAKVEDLRETVKLSEKHAISIITIAQHWIDTINQHREVMNATGELLEKLRQSNKITQLLNRIYDEYNCLTVNGTILGVICCDESGKVIALNKYFNPGIDMWELGNETAAIQNVSILFQNSVIPSVQKNESVVFMHGETCIFIRMLKSQDAEHFLLLSVIGASIRSILMPLLEKHCKIFIDECQNNEELSEIISSARSTIKEYITQIRNKYVKAGIPQSQ